MPAHPRKAGLEIEEDIAFQRKEWFWERVGWFFMVMTILAGLLGVFGTGVLSWSSAAAPDGSLHVEYDSLLHNHSPAHLRITVDGQAVPEEALRLWIDNDYLDGVKIDNVIPEPFRVEAGSDGHTFVFPVAAPGQSLVVTFHLQPHAAGALEGRMKVIGKEPLRVSQFVYP